MLFFEDEDRFWKWSALWEEHVADHWIKAEQLAWELREAEMFRSGFYDNTPENVRTFLCEKTMETEAKVLQAARTLDRVFLRDLYDAALGKRSKMTITAQAVMALPNLWDEKWKEKGRKPTWQELRTRVAEQRGRECSDKQWQTVCKALRSIL